MATNPSKDLPDHAGFTHRPLLRFESGDAETDDGLLTDETMAGVAANSNRANWQSLEMAKKPHAGSLAANRSGFPLRRLIGRGGYGEVWEAIQVNLGRHVAVKFLRPDVLEQTRASQPEVTRALEQAFENEALTAAMLEHPNIVPVYDLSVDADGTPRLAMKLVRGTTWHDSLHIDFESDQPVPDFLTHHLPILMAISQAVAFAHSRGVVHRDLKPSQVMVGEFGEVLLMDWGIAAVFDAETATLHTPGLGPDQLLANMEGPAGTPAFMAPEQTQKSQTGVGPWTDVYLLGGILYQLLCGRPPHGALTGKQAFIQACEGVVEPPSQVVMGKREVPHVLEELAMECLAIQPTSRPKSAKQFIRRLEEYLSGAGRRREAGEIRNEILRRLRHAGQDYAELARLDAMALKARVLAPDSRPLVDIHELILARYVHNALEHGDVMLARQQAERIESTRDREELLQEVIRVEERLVGGRRQHRAAMIAVTGMTLVLLAGGARGTLERVETSRERAKAEFLRTSDRVHAEFDQTLNSCSEDLRTVASFFAAHRNATGSQFRVFTDSFITGSDFSQTVTYAPIVKSADRLEFEQQLRTENLPVDGIRERRQNRIEVRAADRDDYVPGRFAAPPQQAEELVGLDFKALPGVTTLLDQVRLSRVPMASAPINFPDVGTRQVAVVAPVLQEGRTEPDGYVLGFWNTQRLLEKAVRASNSEGVAIVLTDDGEELSSRDGELGLAGLRLGNLRDPDNQISRHPINMGGRRWMLEVIAPPHATDREVMAGVIREIVWPVAAILIVVVGVVLSRLRLRSLIRIR
jgi:serine/threonine protein kinase